MLDDPMFTAELIAEKRDREDEAWRANSRITRPDWTHAEGRSPSHIHGPLCSDDIIDTSSDSDIDAAFTAQYADLKAREAWHDVSGHDGGFARCASNVCRGEVPVPR